MTLAIQSTSLVVMFKAFLSSDHLTEATGKTIAITISKNGGAFGNPNAGATNATEVSSGWYKFTADATDTNTVGPLAWRGAAATIDDCGGVFYVLAQYATPTNITAGTIANVTTVNGLAANVITAASIASDAGTEIAAAVWDEDATAHQTAGTFGQGIGDPASFATSILGYVSNIDSTLVGINTDIGTILDNTNLSATLDNDTNLVVNNLPSTILATAVDGSVTVAQSLRLANSANGGKVSGAGTTTVTIRDLADTKDRVVATVDASGNRSAVTRTLT